MTAGVTSPDEIGSLMKNEAKESKKVTGVLERILTTLKLGASQSASVKDAIAKFKDVSVKSGDLAKKAILGTKERAYKPFSAVLARGPLFFIFIAVMFFYIDRVFDVIFKYVTGFFGFVQNHLSGHFIPVSSYGWFSLVTVFLIFATVLVLIIPTLDNAWKQRLLYKMYVIYFIVFGVLFVWGFFGDPDNDVRDNAALLADRTSETYLSLWDKLGCMFDPSCYLEKQGQVDSTQSYRTEYDIDLDKTSLEGTYNLKDLKSMPFNLDYEIQAKGGKLYLEKIECYEGNSDGKLISSIPFDNQELKYVDRRTHPGIFCDLSSLETASEKVRDFKLAVVLYYSIEIVYSQSIPAYNLEKYMEMKYGTTDNVNVFEEMSAIEKEVGEVEPVATNNVIKMSVNANPDLPVFMNSGLEGYSSYRMTFDFSRDKFSDKVVSSKIVDKKFPEYLKLNCQYGCDDLDKEINAFDNEVRFSLLFDVLDMGGERIEYKESVQFTMLTHFKSEDVIRFNIDNPDYKPATDSSAITDSGLSYIELSQNYYKVKNEYEAFIDGKSNLDTKKREAIEEKIRAITDKLSRAETSSDGTNSDYRLILEEVQQCTKELEALISEFKNDPYEKAEVSETEDIYDIEI